MRDAYALSIAPVAPVPERAAARLRGPRATLLLLCALALGAACPPQPGRSDCNTAAECPGPAEPPPPPDLGIRDPQQMPAAGRAEEVMPC